MAKQRVADNIYIVTRGKNSYYYLRVRRAGKLIERSLGNAELVTLREARQEGARLLLDIDTEIENKVDTLTVQEACEKALIDIARVKKWTNEKSHAQWQSSLATYVYPIIGQYPIDKISRREILKVLLPIWEVKNETAARVRMRLEAVINWAIRHEYRQEANPATWRGNLEFDLPPVSKVKKVVHHASMTIDESRQVVSYCLSHPSPVSAAILFGIATASRVNEFRLARRQEIIGDVWFVPESRRKDKKPYPHRVPLSSLAIQALEMVKNNEDFLFVNTRGEVICADSPRLKLNDILKTKVTMHGCRSTFRDWCAENGVDRVLAEKCLMHATGNEVEQAYQRSDLLEQRRPVMQQWANTLTELVHHI